MPDNRENQGQGLGENLPELEQTLTKTVEGATNWTLADLNREAKGVVQIEISPPENFVCSPAEFNQRRSCCIEKSGEIFDAVLLTLGHPNRVEMAITVLFGNWNGQGQATSIRTSEVLAIAADHQTVITQNSSYQIGSWFKGPDEFPNRTEIWTHFCSLGWSRLWPQRPQNFHW